MARSLQARSRATEERILAATEQLLATSPFEELSIAAIADEIGISVGGIYARFESKDALLRALHERYEAHRTTFLSEALDPSIWRGADLESRVRGICAAMVTLMRERRHVLRSFLLRHWSHPTKAEGEFATVLSDIYQRAIDLMLSAPGNAIGARKPVRAARIALSVIAGSCRDMIVMKPVSAPGAIETSDKELIDALTRAALGILQVKGANK